MVDDPLAFAREEHKKGGNTVQLIYKALLILCVVSLAILVPALFVAATWLQTKEGEKNENE